MSGDMRLYMDPYSTSTENRDRHGRSERPDDLGSQSGSDEGSTTHYQDPSVDYDDDPDALASQTLNTDGTPRRPMNAFMIFARRRRPQVSAENQAMRTGEISKILSKEWSGMPPSEKQFYLDRAKQLKETFNSNYPDYVYRRRPNNSRKKSKRRLDPGMGGLDHRGTPEAADDLGTGPGNYGHHHDNDDRHYNSGLSRLSHDYIGAAPARQSPYAFENSTKQDTPSPSIPSLPKETIDFAHRMFDAARNGDSTLLAAVDAGLSVNLTNAQGNTLLMLAAYSGHADLTKELLVRGADPNRPNDRGQSIVAGAVFKGYNEVVNVLMKHGADPRLGQPTAIETAHMFGKGKDLMDVLGAKECDIGPDVPSSPSFSK